MNSKISPATKAIGLIVSIAICFAFAGLGSAATTPGLADWYASLAKPTWNPPNWIFAPVWSTLFLMMAVAAWLVWCRSGLKGSRAAMLSFGVQLLLNVAWSFLFFWLQSPSMALVEIAILWLAIAVTIRLFFNHSKIAAWLMAPYLCWVSFAAFLNFTIWSLNR